MGIESMVSDLKIKYEGASNALELKEAEALMMQEPTEEKHYPPAPFVLAKAKSNKAQKRKDAKRRRRTKKKDAADQNVFWKSKQQKNHKTFYDTYDKVSKAEAKNRDELRERKDAIDYGYSEYCSQVAEEKREEQRAAEDALARAFYEQVCEIKNDPAALGAFLKENLSDIQIEYVVSSLLKGDKVWIE